MQRTVTAILAATVAASAFAAPMVASAQPYGGYGYNGGQPYAGNQYAGGYGGQYYAGGQGGNSRYMTDCQVKKRQGTTNGAVIGALAGAVIGSQVSGRGQRSEGSAVGALAGAVLGSQIGRSSAKNSEECLRYGYYDNRQDYRMYGQAYYYRDGFYDQRGQWHRYDRRYDRRYYQQQYGYGQSYDSYNYDRRGW